MFVIVLQCQLSFGNKGNTTDKINTNPLILEQLNPPYHSFHIFAKKSHSNRQKSFGTLTPKNPRKIIMPLEKHVFFTCDQPQSHVFSSDFRIMV